jgi:hypothetical protein
MCRLLSWNPKGLSRPVQGLRYLVHKYSTSFPYLSCWNKVFGLEAENLIAFEIYAVIWEILVLNSVIVMPHLFWYGTSGDNPFPTPGRNYMRVSITELFKSSYYRQNGIARMVSSSKTADWVPGCVKYVLFRLLSIQERWPRTGMQWNRVSRYIFIPFLSRISCCRLSTKRIVCVDVTETYGVMMCQVVVLLFTFNVTDTSEFVCRLPRYLLSTLLTDRKSEDSECCVNRRGFALYVCVSLRKICCLHRKECRTHAVEDMRFVFVCDRRQVWKSLA